MRKRLIWASGGAVALAAMPFCFVGAPEPFESISYLMIPGAFVAACVANPHGTWFLVVTVAVNFALCFLLLNTVLRFFPKLK